MERAISEPEEAIAGGSVVILVVERDAHVRDLEGFFLREAGFTVEFAKDGNEAIERVVSLRPDVVITEILIPGLDGLAVCRRIREDPDLAGTRVLIFSILAAGRRAEEAGADAFLRKPLSDTSLVITVRNLLAMKQVSR